MLTDEKLNHIIFKGMPKKQSILDCIRNIGLKYLFFGMSNLIVTIILFFVFLFGLIVLVYEPNDFKNMINNTTTLNTFLITVCMLSPLMFIFFSLISAFEERNTSLFELKNTFIYNNYLIIGIKMFLFSGFSVLFNVITVIVFSLPLGKVVVLSTVCLSLCSLFLYSILLLILISRTNSIRMYLLPSFIWIVFNASLFVLNIKYNIKILSNIPALAYVISAFILMGIFYFSVKRFITLSKGDFKYVTYKQYN